MKTLRLPSARPALFGTLCTLALLGAACAAPAQEAKPAPVAKPAKPPPPIDLLSLDPLAGQAIPILPITFLLSDSVAPADLPEGRRARLLWADSIVGEAMQTRGPEVSWVLPPELRLIAKRAPGMVTDPDKMGQALLRNDSFEKTVPDPLRSYLRALNAITDGRHVFVPASVRFVPVPSGVRVEVTTVLVDSRSGQILWRSHPVGNGATAAAALADAIAQILPDQK